MNSDFQEEARKRLQKERRIYLFKLMTSAYAEQEFNPDQFQFNHVFIVCGFTGSGKDTVIDGFLQRNDRYPFSKFVRTLTRPKRPGENEILSGYFVEKELFDHLKERGRFFYNYEKYDGDEFGYDAIHLLFLLSKGNVIMVGGMEQNVPGLKKGVESVFSGIPISTIFVNRPKNDIITGIRKRGGDPEQIDKRIKNVEELWTDRPIQHFDHFIWAENPEEAILDFQTFIESTLEPPKEV